MKKLKTFVITVAKTFPATHPRKGEPTNFKEKILSGEKIHTIRLNYEYWEPKIKMVNNGEAIISLREWIGLPYKKPGMQEIKKLTQKDNISIQPVTFFLDEQLRIDWTIRHDISYSKLSKNDGLSLSDFIDWFEVGENQINAGIIHFTDFKY